MHTATDTQLRNNPELLRYTVQANYSHILDVSANPMKYRRLAKLVRRLAQLEHCTTDVVLADLRDMNTVN